MDLWSHRRAHPDVSWVAIGLNSLALLVSGIICIALHEASHALVAKAVGLHVEVVALGAGPIVWEWSDGRTDLELRAVPFGGHVAVSASSLRCLRARLMAAILAGPLANVVVLAPSLRAFPYGRIFPDGTICLEHFYDRPHPTDAFFLANVLLALSNLVPIPPTDTWQFLSAPFRGRRFLSEYVTLHGVMKAAGLVDEGRVVEAKAVIETVLIQDPLSESARAMHESVVRHLATKYVPLREGFARIAWTPSSGLQLRGPGCYREASSGGVRGRRNGRRKVLGLVPDFDGCGDSFESTVARYAYFARRIERHLARVS
jgi:Zn-dependent protease